MNGVNNNQVNSNTSVPTTVNPTAVAATTIPVTTAAPTPASVPLPTTSVPETIPAAMVVTAPPTVPTSGTVPPTVPVENAVKAEVVVPEAKVVKVKSRIAPFLFLIILLLGAYALYTTLNSKSIIENLEYNCTPISSANEYKDLELDSTIVQDLYSKVYTTVREDAAQPEWNDTMKIYLAYRQITEDKKYESNCNLFDDTAMNSYTCHESSTFTPKAFKQEELEVQWKKLFGEETAFTYSNIKLDYDCIGGYQYIADRKEYVQGYCSSSKALSLKAKKELTEASTNGNTIILKEEVEYSGTDSSEVYDYLKSGFYTYTFRLDMNYNYVLISRIYESSY